MNQRVEERTITHYLAIMKRYKWLIVATTLIVPFTAYVVSIQQAKVYRATAQVLLNRQDIGATITGIPTQSTLNDDPTRYANTQTQLAQVPSVREAAVGRARVHGVDADKLASIASVTGSKDSDILSFAVDYGDSGSAERLATAYANAFTSYKLKSDTASLAEARRELEDRMSQLRRSGASGTETYRQLLGQAQNLRTLERLLRPATVIQAADEATQIAPTPRRNAVLGAILGLLIGVGSAFGLNTLDRRIRHADDIEYELQIPLLARLPTPQRGDSATILERPPDETTEAFARLRAAFDFANSELGARVVLVTSAGPGEGKSTTVANLGITLARMGRHVVIVDLDLRRPTIAHFLHLSDGLGIADLATSTAQLPEVLQSVNIVPLHARVAPIRAAESGVWGRLEVVPPGKMQVEHSALMESQGLSDAFHTLASHAEIVLIDAPPILATGDAAALTGKVDAVLLLSRLGIVTRQHLQELVRVLGRSPAPVLGLVVTGAEIDEAYSVYAAGNYYAQHQGRREAEAPDEMPNASRPPRRWSPPSDSAGRGDAALGRRTGP